MNNKHLALINKIKSRKMSGLRAGGKSEALRLYKALKNKHKAPKLEPRKENKDSEYKKLSIEEWEAKYDK